MTWEFQQPCKEEKVTNNFDYNDSDVIASLCRGAYYLDSHYIPVGMREAKKSVMIQSRNVTRSVDFDSVSKLLSTIQSSFGLSTNQLAELLGVSPKDIFQWTRKEGLPANFVQGRLQQIALLAEQWNLLSPLPADDKFFEKSDDGLSLFDLLMCKELDIEAICLRMVTVAKQTKLFFGNLRKNSINTENSQNYSEFDMLNMLAYRTMEE
jgi:hypothetical protein